MNKNLTAIDLFCGAGGLSEGFRQAGFKILAGNDIFEAAGRTFALTHPEATFFPGSIYDLRGAELLAPSGLKKGELTCLVGGPPCQAFSVYNHQRGMHDARSHLFREYLRIVDEIEPEWIVMENVTGILSLAGGAAVDEILLGFKQRGYHVEYRVLRAEEYGVPQERRRVVFIGNRCKKPILWPTRSHGEGLKEFTTIRDAIGDLPPLENGQDVSNANYLTAPSGDYQRLIRGNSKVVLNHAAPKLGAINLERMRHIPQGGSWRDIPHELLPAGMQRAKRSDHTKRYGRMAWNGLSSTVLTKCDLHWGAFIHPEQERTITVREAARIQSFPDWFEFLGSRTEQYIQVGNAVPPLLGRHIGKAVINSSINSVEKDMVQSEVAA
ncbi:MAG: DNA cytosine methyltransferase [Alphaproteobacteria bacterium]|nr:MAG: DNA cytosine methyltransferase [Alphaproteobacteria bacterium]